MKVDTQRIRLERERRAWTQAQLAGATGLGLRTVQRIEREGTASFESAQAIAAALELSIADLRLESGPTPDPQMPAQPYLRFLLAALSGVAVVFWLDWRDGGVVVSRGPFWASAFDYLVPGCLFAAAVLIPELPAGRTFVRRALGLVLASTLSFFTAVMITLEGPEWLGTPSASSANAFASLRWEPSIYTSLFASVVGAAIVLAAARWLIGVDRPLRLWSAGMIAALLGGFVLHGSADVRFEYVGFATWHALLCLAIRFGRGTEWRFPALTPLIRSVREVLPGGKFWRVGTTPN